MELYKFLKQLIFQGNISYDAAKPLNAKFCADPELIEFTVSFNCVDSISFTIELTKEHMRFYLESKATNVKGVVTLEKLDEIVFQELHINMSNSKATEEIHNLFLQFYKIL